MKQPGFFDLDRRHKKLVKTRGFLENLNRFVAWESFRALLDEALKRSSGAKGGRPAHDAVLKNDSQDTWADSAYRSEEQEARLKKQGRASHIHERAYRNKPLTPEQEAANTERSRVRVRIEHVFGHIETAMHGCYVRTIGIARAKAKACPREGGDRPRSHRL